MEELTGKYLILQGSVAYGSSGARDVYMGAMYQNTLCRFIFSFSQTAEKKCCYWYALEDTIFRGSALAKAVVLDTLKQPLTTKQLAFLYI